MKEGEYIAEYGGSVRFANMKAIDSGQRNHHAQM